MFVQVEILATLEALSENQGIVPKRVAVDTQNNNNPWQINALVSNHIKCKKPIKKQDDNVCSYCGMNGHWACVCRTNKHFVDFYQASIKGKDKIFKTHSTKNAYEEANIKINNAMIEDIHIPPINDIPFTLIEAKSLTVSDFIKDLDDKAKSPIGGK